MISGIDTLKERLDALLNPDEKARFNNLSTEFQFFSLCDKELGYLKIPDDKTTLEVVQLFLGIHLDFNINAEFSHRMTVLFYLAKNNFKDTALFLFDKGLRWPSRWNQLSFDFETHWNTALHHNDCLSTAVEISPYDRLLPHGISSEDIEFTLAPKPALVFSEITSNNTPESSDVTEDTLDMSSVDSAHELGIRAFKQL